jgi:hypothetical protein
MRKLQLVNLQTAAVALGNGVTIDFLDAGIPFAEQISVQVEGITTATVTFEVSNDGSTFYAQDLAAVGVIETPTNAATADGMFLGTICARYFRARISAWTSGTIAVTAVFA